MQLLYMLFGLDRTKQLIKLLYFYKNLKCLLKYQCNVLLFFRLCLKYLKLFHRENMQGNIWDFEMVLFDKDFHDLIYSPELETQCFHSESERSPIQDQSHEKIFIMKEIQLSSGIFVHYKEMKKYACS